MPEGTKQKKNGLVTKDDDQTHYCVTEVVTIKIMKDLFYVVSKKVQSG